MAVLLVYTIVHLMHYISTEMEHIENDTRIHIDNGLPYFARRCPRKNT